MFDIVDTGPGLTEQDRTQVFQEFKHASNTDHSNTGTGLGLTISARLVRAMGGKISLASEVGWCVISLASRLS